jgi:hypothetical protein
MKKLVLLVLALLGGGAVAYQKTNREVQPYLEKVQHLGGRFWASVEANPVPIVIALGTFVLTFVYHWAKGKSFRESVEVAATRVTVVSTPVPAPAPGLAQFVAATSEPENPVLKRAQARATRTQLLADQVALKARIRKLPEAVTQAEKDFCFAEKVALDAKNVLGEKHKARNLAQQKLAELRAELATGQSEIDAIELELQKLAVVV